MRLPIVAVLLLACYIVLLVPFTRYLEQRPVAVKLGYTPEAEVLKLVTADQRTLVAELSVLKVLFYFGSLVEKNQHRVNVPPEYYNMYRTLETAVKLDPYNMDAYYFAQAAFTWEVGRAQDVNKLLLYGMKYRTWDWTLPYYVAFNDAYFLKDYTSAAAYMRQAAALSHEPLLTNLAARYFYESGRADLGILFLDGMEKSARDNKVKKVFSIRKEALLAVKSLSDAVQRFRQERHRLPLSLSELVSAGYLDRIPADPYGGEFYLSAEGVVRSSSKFAFRSGK